MFPWVQNAKIRMFCWVILLGIIGELQVSPMARTLHAHWWSPDVVGVGRVLGSRFDTAWLCSMHPSSQLNYPENSMYVWYLKIRPWNSSCLRCRGVFGISKVRFEWYAVSLCTCTCTYIWYMYVCNYLHTHIYSYVCFRPPAECRWIRVHPPPKVLLLPWLLLGFWISQRPTKTRRPGIILGIC